MNEFVSPPELRAEQGGFAVGHEVTARAAIGLFRPRVPAGTCGVIAAFTTAGEAEVQFANGRVELVRLGQLEPCRHDHGHAAG